jgi:hypothetical protein
MKVTELFEAYSVLPKLENIGTIGVKQAGNVYTVSASAKSGPIVAGIMSVCKTLGSKKGYTLKTLTGKVIDQSVLFKLYDTRPYGVKVVSDEPNAAEVIQKAAESATAGVISDFKKMVQHKKDAPKRKAEASKYAAAGRREDMKKYDELYGKGTWNRVTYKQEGGDDGYQYVVRVDGRVIDNGLTLSSAKYEKREAVKRLAKKEGLGTFGKKS